MKRIVVGILAHVDAGKTTLSEAILYETGNLKKIGRVDHQDTFLDYDAIERNRGITVFSKPAIFSYKDTSFTLLDTPGHYDFSSEMERALQVLDIAVLVISGKDGIQSHTKTIYKLLESNHVPTFIFVNKMDSTDRTIDEIIHEINEGLNCNAICLQDKNEHLEDLSLTNSILLDYYLEHDAIDDHLITNAIFNRELFPVYYGSALKLDGVESLLEGLNTYTKIQETTSDFKAQVYKVSYENNIRITFMKIISGTLKVKEVILDNQKIDDIRLYSGLKYESIKEATSGMIVGVKGLKDVTSGTVISNALTKVSAQIKSCMIYDLIFESHIDPFQIYSKIKILDEEDPSLEMQYDNEKKKISVHLMGEIQIEILKQILKDRFSLNVEFSNGEIIYKETIAAPVLGVGHYEPLRHYAEVHLLLEPLENGKGLVFESKCLDEDLPKNFQNLILQHLQEKVHVGVLGGYPITDMKISVVNGRHHLKHTEGGDFRESTYRAVRQGLKMANSILLEPYYHFDIVVPSDVLSTLIYHIQERNGTYEIENDDGNFATVSGSVSVASFNDYNSTFLSYTKGKGKLSYYLDGYHPVSNQEELVQSFGYDSENDLANPTGSVFCSHGAGYLVSYDEVYNKMHIESSYLKPVKKVSSPRLNSQRVDEDLMEIFERTYGKIETRTVDQFGYRKKDAPITKVNQAKPQCILVDGYNLIHAIDELEEIMKDNLDLARTRLINLLSNYQGYLNVLMIVVFDAYLVKEGSGSITKDNQLYIVYTKEAQTADMFIERTTHRISQDFDISVVTSDALEQLIVMGKGARRISSREFYKQMMYDTKNSFDEFKRNQQQNHTYALEDVKKYKGGN